MRRLRGDGDGGRGKLSSCQVVFISKGGEAVPVSLNARSCTITTGKLPPSVFSGSARRDSYEGGACPHADAAPAGGEDGLSREAGRRCGPPAQQPAERNHVVHPADHGRVFAARRCEENLFRILRDAERCRDTVRELLEFARQAPRKIQPHDINHSIERTLFLLENQPIFPQHTDRPELSRPCPASRWTSSR